MKWKRYLREASLQVESGYADLRPWVSPHTARMSPYSPGIKDSLLKTVYATEFSQAWLRSWTEWCGQNHSRVWKYQVNDKFQDPGPDGLFLCKPEKVPGIISGLLHRGSGLV
jgi:hypothetical protein